MGSAEDRALLDSPPMRTVAMVVACAMFLLGCSRGAAVPSMPRDEAAVPQDANIDSRVDTRKRPDLIPGSAPIYRGPDKELPRRAIRRCQLEQRPCQAELANHPGVEGNVTVRFSIGAKGEVVAAELKSTTMGNAEVETCLVAFVRKCSFPKPLGGWPTISYTFEFPPSKEPPVTVEFPSGLQPPTKARRGPHR